MQENVLPSAVETAVDQSGFAWPVSFMRHERFPKGQRLFNKGDRADKLYYVAKGSIALPELGRRVQAGQVIGEMGIFSPTRCRTASAVVLEDVEAYTMGD